MFPIWVGGGDGSSLRVVGLPAICSPSGYFMQLSSPVNVSCFCVVVFGNFTFWSLTFLGQLHCAEYSTFGVYSHWLEMLQICRGISCARR